MKRITERAHEAVRAVAGAGDTVIDATIGNGHDTVFLAQQVGPGGAVYGFDVQATALEATERRLWEEGIDPAGVHLIQAGHEEMANYVRGAVTAVMFNLGYLPGGERALTTRPATTLAALEEALRLLNPDGLISVVCYRGHAGGATEGEAVLAWAERKASLACEIVGREESESGPYLVVMRKGGA